MAGERLRHTENIQEGHTSVQMSILTSMLYALSRKEEQNIQELLPRESKKKWKHLWKR